MTADQLRATAAAHREHAERVPLTSRERLEAAVECERIAARVEFLAGFFGTAVTFNSASETFTLE